MKRNYDFWKMFNFGGVIVITAMSIFSEVNLLYAVIMLLTNIFLSIEEQNQ